MSLYLVKPASEELVLWGGRQKKLYRSMIASITISPVWKLSEIYTSHIHRAAVRAAREKLLALAANRKIKLSADWKPTSLIAVINAR